MVTTNHEHDHVEHGNQDHERRDNTVTTQPEHLQALEALTGKVHVSALAVAFLLSTRHRAKPVTMPKEVAFALDVYERDAAEYAAAHLMNAPTR